MKTPIIKIVFNQFNASQVNKMFKKYKNVFQTLKFGVNMRTGVSGV